MPSVQFVDGSEVHLECYNPLCAICHTPVRLETSKTDSNGNAIHEDCYVRTIASAVPPLDS